MRKKIESEKISEKMDEVLRKTASINKDEYEILYNWYSEWVKICRLIAAFSFAAIGFTIVVFDVKGIHKLPPKLFELIKQSWFFLGLGGILSGVSIMLAYIWLDAFSRSSAPSLIGKAVLAHSVHGLKIGVVGWIITVSSAFCTLAGLVYVIVAARSAQ